MTKERQELREMLLAWQCGERQPWEVRDWADAKEDEKWAKADEVIGDIVAHLAILDINLTTPDEIPLYLRMLELPAAEALRVHAEYGAAQDIEALKEKWKDDPYYSQFLP